VLRRWEFGQIEVLSQKDGTETKIEAIGDQAACLEAIASGCASLAQIPGVIAKLFDDAARSEQIVFSSVNRAKGSEARRVFYIQIPYGQPPTHDWQIDQRRNLRYVALTRSLESLYLISPD
jgi:hypothetical protein